MTVLDLAADELSMTDHELIEAFERVSRLTDELLNGMSPAERDRMLQQHLAQARGPRLNLQLALDMTDFLLQARAELARGAPEAP